MAAADSPQFAWQFFTEPAQKDDDDPFYCWLHDDKSVKIDWNTFGTEQIKTNATIIFKAMVAKMPDAPPLFEARGN